jgi:hypothetical protein
MKVRTRSNCLLLLNPLDLAKLSQKNHLTQKPTTELVVSLIVNNEKHLLRALADTGASSSIILEAYNSAIFPFIKTDDKNTTTWSTMGGKFTTTKTGFVTFSIPEFNFKKQISWAFHVDDRSESSITYDIIIGNQPRSSWRIRHNHEL